MPEDQPTERSRASPGFLIASGAGAPDVGQPPLDVPRRVVPKPAFVDTFEAWVGAHVAVHPHVLSALKVVVVTPLLALTLKQIDVLPGGLTLAVLLFLVFGVLDAADGIVARARGLATDAGRVIDRLSDLPLLLLVLWASKDVVPWPLLAAKLALDGLLLVLSVVRRSRAPVSTENRIRTSLADATLLVMLIASQNPWGGADGAMQVPTSIIAMLLVVNIAFSAFVGLVNTGVLQTRFIADTLSALNGLCGVFSIALMLLPDAATIGSSNVGSDRAGWCLLLLLVGAGFDGLDGAAARKWGGTRFGVLADDIADGVSYALAPGVVVAVVVAGRAGVVIGIAYAAFTISRLVYFTLNKGSSGDDPRYFRGVPSTIGGIVVLCAAILFDDDPALSGFFTGIACVLMVGFDSAYKHLGRVLFGLRRERQLVAAVSALLLLAASVVWGSRVGATLLLTGSLVYGFIPQIMRFKEIIQSKMSPEKPTGGSESQDLEKGNE